MKRSRISCDRVAPESVISDALCHIWYVLPDNPQDVSHLMDAAAEGACVCERPAMTKALPVETP